MSNDHVEDLVDEDGAEGIEPEDTAAVELTEPFDPKRVRVEQKSMNVDLIVRRLKHDEIDLAPAFQRKGGIWKDREQSRLVESLLIRIPIPAFYIDASDESESAKWVIVDGLQRMTALSRFIVKGELRLTNLEFLTDLEGKSFAELPRAMQRRIEETQLVIYTLEPGTPPELKFNIFKRINTGGLPLSLQEIRHALNQGPAVRLLEELAESGDFAKATAGSFKHEQRMNDRECVLRFLAFAATGWEHYSAPSFDYFLNVELKRINGLSEVERTRLAERCSRALKASTRILGKQAFRKVYRIEETRRRPLSKALFEVWMVAFDRRTDEELARLEERKGDLLAGFADLMKRKGFDDAVSASTGDPSRVRERFKSIEELVKRVASEESREVQDDAAS